MSRSRSNRAWSDSIAASFPIRQRRSAESSNRASAAKEPTKACSSFSRRNTSRSTGKGNAMEVIMPQLGETVEEGTVAVWKKKQGDRVAIDELLVEIETDKVATEVPSLVAGTLARILVGAGETVKVGTPLAIIDTGAPAAAAPKAAGVSAAPAPPARPGSPIADKAAPSAKKDGHGAPLSPVVRKLI